MTACPINRIRYEELLHFPGFLNQEAAADWLSILQVRVAVFLVEFHNPAKRDKHERSQNCKWCCDLDPHNFVWEVCGLFRDSLFCRTLLLSQNPLVIGIKQPPADY